MSLSLHLSIIAHGKGLPTFLRHVPFWQAQDTSNTLIVAPTNDPIPPWQSPFPICYVARAEHNGPDTHIRIRWLFKHLATEAPPADYYMIHEYDSISLATRVPMTPGFHGNLFENYKPLRFLTSRYVNPPWLVDRLSLLAMHSASERWGDSVFEEGEADRFLSAMAALANVPILAHTPAGYSQATIGPEHIKKLRTAIHNGATLIHGLKDAWTLAAACQFHQERP